MPVRRRGAGRNVHVRRRQPRGRREQLPCANCAPAARAAAHCDSVSTPSTDSSAPNSSHSTRIARTAAGRASNDASSFTSSGARSVSSRSGASPSPTPSAQTRNPWPRNALTASSRARRGTCVYGGQTSTVTSHGIRPASRTAPCRPCRPPRSARVPANTLTCNGSSVSLRTAARDAATTSRPSSSGSRRASARMSPVSGRASISSAATPPVIRLTTGWKAKRRVSVQERTGAEWRPGHPPGPSSRDVHAGFRRAPGAHGRRVADPPASRGSPLLIDAGNMTRLSTTLRGLATTFAALLAVTAAPATAQAEPEPKAPADFVALRSVAPTILQDMRYTTAHNFVGERIDGYRQPLCILTRPAAEALHRAQTRLLRQGYSLKVYDCYRPQRAVDHFVRWAEDLDDQRMKAEFYPEVDKTRLFADGYIAEKSGHSRGSTVDLTIVKLPAKPTRSYHPGQPLVPCFAPQDERFPTTPSTWAPATTASTPAHTPSTPVSGAPSAPTGCCSRTPEDVGLVNLPEEWWHFTYKPEPYPDTYFDFPVSAKSLAGRR